MLIASNIRILTRQGINMKDRKKLAIVIIMLLFLVGLVGGTVSYMIKTTDQLENDFASATVDCVLNEQLENNVKSNITVNNTGNIGIFVRVRFITYWIDSNGNVAGIKAPVPLNITFDSDWIKDPNSDTFYYSNELPAASTTSDLLDGSSITLATEDGYRQVVEVFAEAIQANPAQAASNEWNVTVTDGKIVSIN